MLKQVNSAPLHVPEHIAIIMDGNGRWGTSRNLPRVAGHKAGGDTLKKIVRAAGELGIGHLSVYAFSTENWTRPQDEVDGLMKLLVEFCKREVPELKKTNTRIKFVGDIDNMPDKQKNAARNAEKDLEACTGMQLNVCLNYGGRGDIVHAVKEIVKAGYKESEITDELVASHLYTQSIPDPDLLIRTSGEYRISNYYLWQVAYSEFVFVDKYWPDFTKEDLVACIEEYNLRTRRFGGI
ncbi:MULTISPECIES: isoprenyl transferase [unclassified Fusibacter]|uniref:isoprenyl transferase n=1 Tax=unclassified Fusibacter TaxID=2624464 RepID=UPI001013877B|nr:MULTISPECIES: isoprenyl transferase [unclassified Fusibacter]MCK8058793.1 isoprenyl transferase [Fusibacter sp. A2]NPE21867.1 isoprenyl transferase [Fusibacter sp. A1]RXV61439.1 isoprenyl transferase [Fusibacter sp. A1]